MTGFEMVVYCVFHRMCPSQYSCIYYPKTSSKDLKSNKVKWITEFRVQHTKGYPWDQLLELARKRDYTQMKSVIRSMSLIGVC